MKITILGKTWKLKFVSFLGYADEDKECPILGKCDDPESGPDRVILIKKGLASQEELDTVIHELLHAANFKQFSEEYVEELATDLTNVLWKLGWRKIPKPKLKEFDQYGNCKRIW